MIPIDVAAFARTQLALLDAELQSEIEETSSLIGGSSPSALQRAGLAVTNLAVCSQRTGFGGRTVLELAADAATGELPEHGLRTGDIVLVAEQPAGSAKKREVRDLERKGVRGVVVRIKKEAIAVAVDEEREDAVAFGGRVWLVKLADDVTYRRMNQVMQRMRDMPEAEYSGFVRVLFGLGSPSPVPADLRADEEVGEGKVEWFDPGLNESQKDAIRFALRSREIALIHGPPGTGKTHTLIELILQLVKRNQRVLVCGPSNISVDNIVERLSPHRVPIVRLGHPARLLPSVLSHSLDVLTQTSEAGLIVKDVRNEMDAKQASIKKTRSGKDRKAIYADLKELRKEYRERERRCVGTLIGGSKVVLATLHGAGGFQLKNEEFDVVIIDEASQALEAQCWVPLLAAKKAVCAGDHLQLPPTVKSTNSKSKAKPKAKAKGVNEGEEGKGEGELIKGASLETTLFDRLLKLHGKGIKRMLTTQYRMHEKIMRFPSDELYEGRLVAADAVKERLLKDLEYEVQDTEDTNEPVIFIDTQGGDFPEKNEEEEDKESKGKDKDKDGEKKGQKKATAKSLFGESKSNEMEAALVRQHVKKLVDAGVRAEDIAVVTPYNAQLGLLAPLKEAFPGIELGSVDGFQGREKEAVIVSLVRSNSDGEVGFLSEKRRLNVAMTRPKRSLVVVGDSETVRRGSKFLNNWMEWLENNADLRYIDSASIET
ncbi:DNA helicase [Rostrohypoxylon terebratum]|nr:DNA helicase [Rostrohypoxylon terebratum]